VITRYYCFIRHMDTTSALIDLVNAPKPKWYDSGKYHDIVVRLTYDEIVAHGGEENWNRRFGAIETALLQRNLVLKADTMRASWEKNTQPWVRSVRNAFNDDGAQLITLLPLPITTATSSTTILSPLTPPTRRSSTHVSMPSPSVNNAQPHMMLVDISTLMDRIRTMESTIATQADQITQLQTSNAELNDSNTALSERFDRVATLINNAMKKRSQQPQRNIESTD